MSFLLLVGIAYIPAYSCDFIWDDDHYVTDNGTLRTPAGLAMIWLEPETTPQYYPMVFTTFWVEYHLWTSAAGYHFVNVLLHGFNSGLVWLLCAGCKYPGPGSRRPFSPCIPCTSNRWRGSRSEKTSCRVSSISARSWLSCGFPPRASNTIGNQ